ncbi:LOW QUALITY PROTEIN: hypothetical protein ACHAWX_000902 [Stephanocyclus meneghinianus]
METISTNSVLTSYPFLVLSHMVDYQQGIMGYFRDSKKMEASLLDTILAGVRCIYPEDRADVLVVPTRENGEQYLLDSALIIIGG